MTIDGIGKKTGLESSGPVTSGNGESMTVGALHEKGAIDMAEVAEAGPAAALNAPGSIGGPLGDLQAGRIDLERYMEIKVNEATAHLTGLSGVDLDDIKRMLLDKLMGDPTLAALLQDASGVLGARNEP